MWRLACKSRSTVIEAKGIIQSLGAPNPARIYGDVNSQGRLLKGSNH